MEKCIPRQSKMFMKELGDTVVDLATVLSCWASVIKEKMQGAFPELEFKNVISNQDKASFTYVVPALEWKEWF